MALRVLKTTAMALLATAFLAGAVAPATAQATTPAAPGAWALAPDTAQGYADGTMTAYKLGTNNAKFLFKGAKKVPKNTLFFVGENGQLYMRTGPYLENGKFSFGPG